MENENNVSQDNNMNQESMYHYKKEETPYGKEEVNTSNLNQTYYQNNSDAQGVYSGKVFSSQTEAADIKKEKRREKKERRKTSGRGKKVASFLLSAVVFGLVAGGVMFGVNYFGNKVVGNNEKVKEQIGTVAPIDTTGQEAVASVSVADVTDAVMPSIVSITNTSVQTVRSWFQSYEQEVSGSGSGIVIGQTEGEILIVTNNHVIEGAKELTVAFFDETAVEATVKGTDAVADLAVLAVKTEDMEASTVASVKVAALGSSEDLRAGDFAIAIGNALGYGQSVTVGYISAVNREVDVEDSTMTLLQTDAAINPGNSGGALLNANGEVIGINTVKYVDSTVEGMGYAIPISSAIPIINDLMNQEVIEEEEQGYLGIQGNDVTDEYLQSFNMPKGVYVVKIIEGSPADGCGLKAGDIITKFAGRDITSMEALQNILSTKKAGAELEMVVQRNTDKGDYEEVTLTVTLGAKKDMPEQETSTEEVQSSKEQNESNQLPEEYYEYPEDYYEYPGDGYDLFEDFFNGW